MDVQQIDQVFKAKYRLIVQKLGRHPTTKDQETWDLQAWYVGKHQELIDARVNVEQKEERQERYRDVIKPRLERNRSKIECSVCGGVIERTGQRGRPRKIHEECKTKKEGAK